MSQSNTAQRGQLAIICTMSCKEALIELVQVFERESGYAVDATYGSGPELAKKIRGGRRADIFVGPEDPPFAGASGPVGAELLCLQFRRRARD